MQSSAGSAFPWSGCAPAGQCPGLLVGGHRGGKLTELGIGPAQIEEEIPLAALVVRSG